MKKTLLSILALSAGVAFAQKVSTFTPDFSSLTANKDYDTLLMLQGGACSANGLYIGETYSFAAGGDTYSIIEEWQKLSHSQGGKVSETAALILEKRVGGANGATNFFMKIYSVKPDGTPDQLLGTSAPKAYSAIDTTEENGYLNIFSFSPAVTVPAEFIVSLTTADGSTDSDTITLIGSLPFHADSIGNAQFVGDCSMGTSGVKITNGTLSIFEINKDVFDPSAPTHYFDPKLYLGALLEVEEVSVVNNETISYSIFPNPTSDVLNVQYTLANEGTVTMNVVDLTGRVVRNIVKENQGAFQATEQINIAGLNAGIYLLNVTANGNTTTQKFIVK